MRTPREIRSKKQGMPRNHVVPAQGVASVDATVWLAISTAVESLSWDEVELNEVGVRGAPMVVTAKNDRVIFPAGLIGQFTMTPDELLGKCGQLAQARNCHLFKGRDGSIAFQLRPPRRLA
jgi:hypothetical protein